MTILEFWRDFDRTLALFVAVISWTAVGGLLIGAYAYYSAWDRYEQQAAERAAGDQHQ